MYPKKKVNIIMLQKKQRGAKMAKLSAGIKAILKSGAKNLKGSKRRAFLAKIVKDLLGGSARKGEREFGWSRRTIQKGIKESEKGKAEKDNYSNRGNKKTEEKIPKLEDDIREIVEPHSQADPSLKTSLVYTRITARAVRKKLIEEKEYLKEIPPTKRTISNILNRLGYKLRRVQKAKPKKK
ncbi:hypothetical protein UABHE_001664 [Candidatus Uabimicrobium helgolandensis]